MDFDQSLLIRPRLESSIKDLYSLTKRYSNAKFSLIEYLMLALCVNLQSENLRSKKSKVNCVKLLDCLNKKRKLHNKLLTSDSSVPFQSFFIIIFFICIAPILTNNLTLILTLFLALASERNLTNSSKAMQKEKCISRKCPWFAHVDNHSIG